MRTQNQPWAFATVVRKENVIDPRPQYQRGPVWSIQQKQLLIDSILRGIDIPKIYLRELPEKSKKRYQYEVIDGQQRLGAIWEFYNNDYMLGDDFDDIGKHRIASLSYTDLPEKLKDELDTYQLSIVIISDADETDIEEMFLRLQNGTTLKAAERRNAISGNVRDFVRKITKHKLFRNVPFKNIRFSFDAIVAQMLALEFAGGPTDIKDKNLEDLYNQVDFDTNGKIAKNMQASLKFLSGEFKEKTPELKKQVLVSLYLMTSHLLKHYTLTKTFKRGDLKKWFLDFEKYKNQELNKDETEKRDPDIDSYNLNLQQGTNRRESIISRHEVLMRHFLLSHPEVEYKDPQRLFSPEQRLAVFRRDNQKCRKCKKKVDWDDFTVDHIKPYSKGGKTTLQNAQLLCTSCNLKKSCN